MDNKNVYEKFDWEQLQTKNLLNKIEIINEFIPDDVKSIIDIGCGNGIITNMLSAKYDVTGVDRSEKALSFVTTKKILSDAEQIPVKDNSYDLVFSSEMLEHLDDDSLNLAIREMKRISKKYILISVPNGENPMKNSIQCPKCKHIYARSYHLQSFKLNKLVKLFPEYKLLKYKTSGIKVRYYRPFILKLKYKFSPPISWIPYYWIHRNQRNTVCPRCENEFIFEYKFNLTATFFNLVNIVFSSKKPYWLIVLLENNK